MPAFILRRLMQSVLVMLAVALIAFAMFRFVGDPVNAMLPENATPAQRAELRAELGLEAPVVTQFADFVAGAVQGEFGISYRNKRPVSDLIAERLPATLELVLAAALFALVLGVPMGVFTALNRHGLFSNLLQVISLIGISVPTFVTGILLILVFSVWLGWLPSFGRGDTVQIGWWSTGLLTVGSIPVVGTGLARLTQIEGAMPRLSDIPPGCAFHRRCPKAMPDCSRFRPEPRAVADGRVACLLYEGAEP